MGRLDEAAATYEQAVAHSAAGPRPDHPEAHAHLGQVLLQLGRMEEAVAASERALALRPDGKEALGTLGSAFRGLDRLAESEAWPGGFDDLAPELTDFAETAAALAGLDLIISADTAVAHLAGALARPVWVLLPAVPDWRGLRAGAASPWYPTMRLFRQDARREWGPVLTHVADALEERVRAA